MLRPDNFPLKQYYLMFLMCLTCGLRLGEARALRPKQFIFDKGVLIIDGFCKQDGTRTGYNKKGDPDDPKVRITFLTRKTAELMRLWIMAGQIGPDEYCFELNNKPIRTETAENVFYRALQKSNIVPKPPKKPKAKNGEGGPRRRPPRLPTPDGRRLVPHSLRYTFVSLMLQRVNPAELKLVTGHTSEKMVDYYDRRSMESVIASLSPTVKLATEEVFTELKTVQYPETPELDFYQTAN
jgi:integrase